MMRLLLVAFLVAGCTRANPRDCADGVCSDPAYPFCDIDGALAGEPKACVEVACAPSEFRACRGDVSIVCNPTGNDYDLVMCERGCDATHGCRACTTEADCENPAPVCDVDANACRACKLDDECASAVCENGTCLSEAGILYVLPNGSDSSDCSRTQPCSLLQATILARAAAVPPIIRLLPGVYPTGLDLATPTALPLRYVASGATMAASVAVRIKDGAKAEIRGVTAAGSSVTVECTSTTNAVSVLTLKDSVIRVGDGGASLVYVEKCTLTLTGVELDIGASTGTSVTIRGDSTLSADRIHAHGSAVSNIGAGLADRISVKITNSVFENVYMAWPTYDTSSPGSLITLAFNTMVLGAGALDCKANSGSAYRKLVVENNIIVSSNMLSAIDGTDCVLGHNVVTPFTGAAGSNVVGDPQFVDAAAGNFHLMPTSPAVDAAVPSGFAFATADYDGVTRPQGSQPDIGAFERTP